MSRVAIRKNIVIRHQCVNGQSSWNETINIDFVPDEMNVKSTSYFLNGQGFVIADYDPDTEAAVGAPIPIPVYVAAGDITTTYVYSSIVNDIVAVMIDSEVQFKPDTTWTIGKPIAGNHMFQIQSVTGIPYTQRQGVLTIHLEFVKYA